MTEPAVPEDVDPSDLDASVRAELRSLPDSLASRVAGHLVMAGRLLDDDPDRALSHAVAAKRLAARLATVREAVGLCAYRSGDYAVARSELRAARRMTGGDALLPVLADCERGLGRPAAALELLAPVDVARLAVDDAVEVLLVRSGALSDLGRPDAAVRALRVPALDAARGEGWLVRLRYAYATALEAAGRGDEARDWFARAALADVERLTDAAARAGGSSTDPGGGPADSRVDSADDEVTFIWDSDD